MLFFAFFAKNHSFSQSEPENGGRNRLRPELKNGGPNGRWTGTWSALWDARGIRQADGRHGRCAPAAKDKTSEKAMTRKIIRNPGRRRIGTTRRIPLPARGAAPHRRCPAAGGGGTAENEPSKTSALHLRPRRHRRRRRKNRGMSASFIMDGREERYNPAVSQEGHQIVSSACLTGRAREERGKVVINTAGSKKNRRFC